MIGTADLVRGLTRETLLGFYRRLYQPESFTLVVAGPVVPAEVLERARRTFGRLPRSGSQPLPVATPPSLRPRKVEISRPGAQAYLALAWHAPRIDHPDVAAVDLLVTILGQSRTSRLPRALRDELGIVSSVSSTYGPLEGGGVVGVTAQLDPVNLERAEAEIMRELRRIRDEGVTEAERRRAITAAEAQHEFETETVEGRARVLGRAETVWRLDAELSYLDRLRTITREQIRAAAIRYLDPERYVRVTFVPAR